MLRVIDSASLIGMARSIPRLKLTFPGQDKNWRSMMENGKHGEAPLNPGIVFEMVQAVQRTAALKAAIDLDIFRAVGQGPGDVASIARHANASERGIRILCDFLVINGVLIKEGNSYGHTPSSAAFLDPTSPACIASVAHFMSRPELISGLAGLAEVVRR